MQNIHYTPFVKHLYRHPFPSLTCASVIVQAHKLKTKGKKMFYKKTLKFIQENTAISLAKKKRTNNSITKKMRTT